MPKSRTIQSRKSYEATPEEDQLLREMVARGNTCYRICEALGVSQSVAQRWLFERDLIAQQSQPRKSRALNAKEEAEFRTYYKTGVSVSAIAAKFGMGISTVRRLLSERNMDLPKPAAARNYARPNASQQLRLSAQEAALSRRLTGEKEEKWLSPADRFRTQGLTTYNPDRA
jgi:transposase